MMYGNVTDNVTAQVSDCIRSGQKSIMVKPPNQPTNQPTGISQSCRRETAGSPSLWGEVRGHRRTVLAFQADRQAGGSLPRGSWEGVDLKHVLTHRALFGVLHSNTHL